MLFTNSIKFPNIFNLNSGATSIESQYTSINRCIALILTTAHGELLGDPDFGCGLYEKLFNAYTSNETELIKNDIVNSLTKYEKRITITKEDITIESVNNDEHRYNIHLTYKLKNSDVTNDASLTLSEEDMNWQTNI
jgi:phage baseplate assembly protein W